HFPVDPDALTVAASLSESSTPERIPIATVLEELPVSQMRALLERVAAGEGSRVMAELNRLSKSAPASPSVPPIKCTDFAAHLIKARETRGNKEAEEKATKRKRDEE